MQATEQKQGIEFRSHMTVELVQHVGTDLDIAKAAWVSSQAAKVWNLPESVAERTPEKVAGLIRALLRGKHGTPFEHASMTFFVEAPLFVFREWHRHRIGFSYNEASARYQKKMKPVFWLPRGDRPLIKEGKGMAPKFVLGSDYHIATTKVGLAEAYRASWDAYERIVEAGVANEVARACLPVGLYSSMYVTCNPRSLMAFLSLRTGRDEAQHRSYPQMEIEECANMLEAEFAKLFPITHAAYNEFKRVAP